MDQQANTWPRSRLSTPIAMIPVQLLGSAHMTCVLRPAAAYYLARVNSALLTSVTLGSMLSGWSPAYVASQQRRPHCGTALQAVAPAATAAAARWSPQRWRIPGLTFWWPHCHQMAAAATCTSALLATTQATVARPVRGHQIARRTWRSGCGAHSLRRLTFTCRGAGIRACCGFGARPELTYHLEKAAQCGHPSLPVIACGVLSASWP
jgi:hypothetical protein